MSMLRDCVSTRGMRSFISHEVVGRGCFNAGWTSASGNQESWHSQLTNGQDGALVTERLNVTVFFCWCFSLCVCVCVVLVCVDRISDSDIGNELPR